MATSESDDCIGASGNGLVGPAVPGCAGAGMGSSKAGKAGSIGAGMVPPPAGGGGRLGKDGRSAGNSGVGATKGTGSAGVAGGATTAGRAGAAITGFWPCSVAIPGGGPNREVSKGATCTAVGAPAGTLLIACGLVGPPLICPKMTGPLVCMPSRGVAVLVN